MKRDIPFAIGSPAIIWQILFFYLPLTILIFSSFSGGEHIGGWEHLSLDNFRPFFKPAYFSIMFNSLGLAFSTAVICLLIGYPVAYTIALHTKRAKTICLFLLLVPFWTNFLLHVSAWFFVLEREGFLNNLLLKFGLIQSPVHFLNSWFATALMMIYYYLPFMILPLYSALDRFDEKLIEASRDLGASFRQTFLRVILPITMPAITVGFFLVFIPAFGEFIIPEVMGGDKAYFVGNVVSQYILGQKTVPLGAAYTLMSSTFLLISAGLIYLGLTKLKKRLS